MLLLLHLVISLLTVFITFTSIAVHLECVTFNSLNDKEAEKGKGGVRPHMAQ